jgi:hypothetical protein
MNATTATKYQLFGKMKENHYFELPSWLKKIQRHYDKPTSQDVIRSSFNMEHYLKVAAFREIEVDIKFNF